MENLNDYLSVWKGLIDKIKSEKLIIYRIHDCGLYGDSYLFLMPKKTKNIQDYLHENYLQEHIEDSLKDLIKEDNSTIQIFNEPLEREDLNSENLKKLISNGFVQVRTNKIFLHSKRYKDYPESEKLDKKSK